mgnify:CR=1 FL=1
MVQDCVAQDHDSILVSNMRTAIKNTNVVLNMIISPGVILIPSELLILKEPIPGYNNVLALATKGMVFGENKNLKYNPIQDNVEEESDSEPETKTKVPSKKKKVTFSMGKDPTIPTIKSFSSDTHEKELYLIFLVGF